MTFDAGIVNSWSFSSISSAQNGTKCGELIEQVLQQSSGRKSDGTKVTQTLPSANELGMDVDDFLESVNNLYEFKSSCY